MHNFIVTTVAVAEEEPVAALFSGSGDGTIRALQLPRRGKSPWAPLCTILLMLLALACILYSLHILSSIIDSDDEL